MKGEKSNVIEVGLIHTSQGLLSFRTMKVFSNFPYVMFDIQFPG